MLLDPAAVPGPEMYRFLISAVVPRPIAFVSTRAPGGGTNLAPFSYFNALSSVPPLVGIAIVDRPGDEKDTLRNIRETGEFVVATATEDNAVAMNDTSTEFPYGVSEFAAAGLTPLPAVSVRAKLVKESPVNIECRMRQIVSLGCESGAGQVVFGDVRVVHIDDAILGADGLIDPDKLKAIGRMGGHLYTRTRDRFELISVRDPAKRGG